MNVKFLRHAAGPIQTLACIALLTIAPAGTASATEPPLPAIVQSVVLRIRTFLRPPLPTLRQKLNTTAALHS